MRVCVCFEEKGGDGRGWDGDGMGWGWGGGRLQRVRGKLEEAREDDDDEGEGDEKVADGWKIGKGVWAVKHRLTGGEKFRELGDRGWWERLGG